MTPYNRRAGKHFTNQMYSPYFQTENYKKEHLKLEYKVEERLKKIMAFIRRKK